MKPTERKEMCDLISLVANAVATGTIPEAEDYLVDHPLKDEEVMEHTLNVLTTINNKQTGAIWKMMSSWNGQSFLPVNNPGLQIGLF